MGTTWLYRGYMQTIVGLYKVMGLGVPSRVPPKSPWLLILQVAGSAAGFLIRLSAAEYSKRK